MNSEEKIEAVSDILDAYIEELCPYCKVPLLNYVDKKGVERKSCENHDIDLIIEIKDYMSVIINIVKYSTALDGPVKYKRITDF